MRVLAEFVGSIVLMGLFGFGVVGFVKSLGKPTTPSEQKQQEPKS